ncbi:heme peroxidase [Glomus cerebriforme]|uniref:Heme peroxidase n=1 Tax=Glomus cerebriforme TaxID=658196 RepID=A0A397SWS7_9GLOM|nr:heme peroxidase [Glomus cerebriforme]
MSLKEEFYEHLHQIFSLAGLFVPKSSSEEMDSKILQYLLGLDDPIPDKILVELIKKIVIPKLPIDDSKLELEKFISTVSKLPHLPEFDTILPLLGRLLITQLWTDISKPPAMIAGDLYRSSDGSGYNKLSSSLGKANSQYALTSRIQNPIKLSVLPKPDQIFDEILVQDGEFVDHPAGISSMLFYLAIIITHDLFHTSMADPTINLNSSYLDLSPLYGSNADEQKSIRAFNGGLLKPDTFADSRILLQPPGVGALLILFSRNHNYIAQNLLEKNESGRFSITDPNDPKQLAKQDEDLFQTARLVNCGYYINVILHDYLRTILGLERTSGTWFLDPTTPYPKKGQLQSLPTGIGNLVSLEFNYIYRWHPAVSKEDTAWVENEFKEILGDDWENITIDEFKKKMGSWGRSIPKDPSKWTFKDIERDSDNRFKESDIARELINGTLKVAGAFGANRIAKVFRPIELLGIQSARNLGLSSLNDFRRSLNLVPYNSFEEMNPDPKVVEKLEKLYGSVDNVELYPGLMTEKSKPPELGSAVSLPFTVSRAILSDAVNLVRNDRFYTDDFSPRNLTVWGWKEVQSDPNDLSSGGVLHKLILRHVPNIYKENSALALYPFIIPSQTKKNLQSRGNDFWENLDYDVPKL